MTELKERPFFLDTWSGGAGIFFLPLAVFSIGGFYATESPGYVKALFRSSLAPHIYQVTFEHGAMPHLPSNECTFSPLSSQAGFSRGGVYGRKFTFRKGDEEIEYWSESLFSR